MTPHNDLLCALCGYPIPPSYTRIVLNGQRFHPTCATRYALDLAPDPAAEVPLCAPPNRTLVATPFVYFACGALTGLLVAASIRLFGGWLWRIW